MKELFKDWKTIPNLLCVIRILLVPLFVILYVKGYPIMAVSIVVVSGLTDCFDGKIARKFNQVSALGKLLDPIADKLTQIAVAMVLLFKFHQSSSHSMKIFSWVFLFFLVKEVVMLLFGLYMLSIGLKPSSAEIYGKVSTFVFYVVMFLIIGFGPEIGAFSTYDLRMSMPEWMAFTLVIISVVLMFAALGSYIPDVVRQLKNCKNKMGENE